MNNIERFEFDHFNFSRIDDGTTVWFNVKEVATFLDVQNATQFVENVPNNHLKTFTLPTKNVSTKLGTVWVSEVGLYFLLGQSRKPNARPFQWFVADTIAKLRSGKHPLQERVSDLERVVANQAIELDKQRSVISKYGEMRSTEYYSAVLKRTVTPEEARQLSRAMNTSGEKKSGNVFNQRTAKPDHAVIKAAKRLGVIDGETAYNLLEGDND